MNFFRSYKPCRFVFLKILALMVLVLVVTDCTQDHGSEDAGVETVSVKISVDMTRKNSQSFFRAMGTVEDVNEIMVKVEQVSNAKLLTDWTNLVKNPQTDVWEGTLSDLPVGRDLRFTAEAFKSNNQLIFQGVTVVSLASDGATPVPIEMSAVDDGVTPSALPKIIYAIFSEEIGSYTTGNPIAFKIEYAGDVSYDVIVEQGAIDSPTPGTHDPESELHVSYSAPNEPTIDRITLKVWDGGTDTVDKVSTTYPISILEYAQNTGISTIFGPVITGLEFTRDTNSLTIKAITEPEAELTYEWQFGEDSDDGWNLNPLVVANYTDTRTRDLKVKVTDLNNIEASLTRRITAGDFPYCSVTGDPLPITSFEAVPGDSFITLSWGNPNDADFRGVMIRRSESGFPVDVTSGDSVYEGTGTSYLDTGLSINVTYYYSAFTFDCLGRYTPAVSILSTTQQVTNVTTDPLTGKLWQDNRDFSTWSWQNALTRCSGQEFYPGFNSWRLPNREELQTVFINNASEHFFRSDDTHDTYFWSSTSLGDDSPDVNAWQVYSVDGTTSETAMTSNRRVRCVHW